MGPATCISGGVFTLWREMFATSNVSDPISIGMLLAWALLTAAALAGTTMVVVGMIEEVPSIVKSTLRRTMNRQRS
jgi:hypothetical protein